MGHTNFNFKTKDNLELFGRAWLTTTSPVKGIVNLIHGIGEHTGRYDHIGEAFNQAGFHLVGFDLRGHGLSEGKRGFSPSWDHLLNDIEVFLSDSQERFNKDLPVFLYGHSLGANLVLSYGLQRKPDVAGVIATGPSLKLAFQPPKFKLFLGKVLANTVPSFSMSNELEVAALSRDKAIVKAYVDDVYVHDRLSARLAMDLFASGEFALQHAEEWKIPLLLMHGTGDRINAYTATRQFAERGNGYIDLALYDDYYHEIHNDIGKEKVIAKMISWLDDHTGK